MRLVVSGKRQSAAGCCDESAPCELDASASILEDCGALAKPLRFRLVIGEGRRFARQMRRLRQFHLDGMHAGFRLAVVPRRPAALEAAVEDCCIALGRRADRASTVSFR